MKNRRAFLIVLDGVGIGSLPDAAEWNDEGSNTFVHVAEECGPLDLPHLVSLGMGCIAPAPGVKPVSSPGAAYGRMHEQAAGKDTTAGHWELAGSILRDPFPVFPEGFPAELMHRFESAIGRKSLANRPASGTVILEELGVEHRRTGFPIVYTSADSVFQIAAHEDIVPIETLYEWCRIARGLLIGDLAVARVIARPFIGEEGAFRRTKRRRDFSLEPPATTIFDKLAAAGAEVHGIGKIHDIYCGRGITRSTRTADNDEGMDRLIESLQDLEQCMAFVNLNDFDSLWGHRNNPESFARGLEAFDRRLPEMLKLRRDEDLFLITADHGNDPTTPGTDHSREYVPLIVLGPGFAPGRDLGTRETFADVAATLSRHFDVSFKGPGRAMQT